MTYKSGEIYFVRETVLGKSEPSSFVKIGLVALDRSSEDRLKEHQTGNPRRLYNQEVVKTEAVHRVEALMHRFYAPDRVSGEWFDFRTEAKVDEAIAKAKDLAKEMETYVPKFSEAERLGKVASLTDSIDPTTEIMLIATRYSTAKTKLELCSGLALVIREKFKEAIEAGEDVHEGAKETEIFPLPKFSVTALKKDHKEIYEKYPKVTESWSSDFKVSIAKIERASLDGEFLSQFESLESSVESVTSSKDAYMLNEPQLLLTNLAALAQWDFDLAEAELKIACGEAAGITGVCTWVRKVTMKTGFDVAKFAAEMPEMWVEYTLPRDSYKKLVVSRKKS